MFVKLHETKPGKVFQLRQYRAPDLASHVHEARAMETSLERSTRMERAT